MSGNNNALPLLPGSSSGQGQDSSASNDQAMVDLSIVNQGVDRTFQVLTHLNDRIVGGEARANENAQAIYGLNGEVTQLRTETGVIRDSVSQL
jgi:hypothetical protein